jgi:hypothetical protein
VINTIVVGIPDVAGAVGSGRSRLGGGRRAIVKPKISRGGILNQIGLEIHFSSLGSGIKLNNFNWQTNASGISNNNIASISLNFTPKRVINT